MGKKNNSKYKILDYMLRTGDTSKTELTRELNLSMPTVLSNVNELMDQGLVIETGELASTGGRKARTLGIQRNYKFSIGVNLTANHISIVLVNLGGEIIKQERFREKFKPDAGYCRQLAKWIENFYQGEVEKERLLGVGISMPGIIDHEEKVLVKSHALQLENYSLKMMEQMIALPVYFENDANAAMLAEAPNIPGDAVYLSLNNTLGGAICIKGELLAGKRRKAGEFGHMVLYPKGKSCYCGKKGCADAYCAASVLTENGRQTLDDFMERLGKDKEADQVWQVYLEDLAMLISNLRMTFDTDIILGGEVGGYLASYMQVLGEKIFQYNLFDDDLSYLKNCSYRKEASAVGVAKYFFTLFIEQI